MYFLYKSYKVLDIHFEKQEISVYYLYKVLVFYIFSLLLINDLITIELNIYNINSVS